MRKTFICLHCQRICFKNPRLKDNQQQYCGNNECQRARKKKWDREKRQIGSPHKAHRAEVRKKSYHKRKGDRYQAEYRSTHPEYCEENRRKQLFRNRKKRSLDQASKIVKSDTLDDISVPDSLVSKGFFHLLPCENTDTKKIVKSDTLLVQLFATKGVDAIFSINSC